MSGHPQISDIVHLYVEGMALADEAKLRTAFHPDAAVIGNYQGALEWLRLDDFIAAILDEASAPAGSTPLCDIQSIDIVGDAATVKVVDDFAGMRFTDFLSLVKIDGEWKIVNKVYHLHT